ncbi:MAG TPA: SIS domain-containing protein [Steroidobacteraceae bacterium]|jgi:glucosamine--fructose-6-phosphate aminotransferase (isomerizing)
MLSTNGNVIEGRYFHDLMAQPAALEATLAWLTAVDRWRTVGKFVRARSWKRVVLTGMGSSYHGLHVLNLALIEAGLTPVVMETAELIHYGQALFDPQTLVIAVSQSGGSAEILRLLEVNHHAPLLAVTNTADSPLARSPGLSILTQADAEFSVSCKTYVAALLALQWLAGIFVGADEGETLRRLTPAGALVREYLGNWRSHTTVLADELQGIRHLFLTGRGSSLAAAGTGALIIKESARFTAEGMSSAAFRHGPMEMLRGDVLTLVFTGDEPTRDLNRRLVSQLRTAGWRCEEIGDESAAVPLRTPQCDPLLRPVLEILPVQLLTLALASLDGREAGRFEFASKVTDTE